MPHIIFKTDKATGESKIVGQTPDVSLSNVSGITHKTTGEKPLHITSGNNWRTGHTENHQVEFIDKEDIRETFLR